MANIKDIALGKSDVYRVDPRILKIKDGWNSRDFTLPDNIAHIEELAASIAENGVRKPIEIFRDGDDFFVSDGECRLRGTMLAIERGAAVETVPVINEQKGANEVDRLLLQHIGNSGKQFSTLEKGNLFYRLVQMGVDEATLAKRIGVSAQHVRDCLQLRSAPAAVTKLIKSGDVSPTLALQTIKKTKGDGKAATAELTKAVKTAKSGGKKKATARDVATKGKTFKQEISELVAQCEFLAKSTPTALPGMKASPPNCTIRMPLAAWERLVKLVPQKAADAVE